MDQPVLAALPAPGNVVFDVDGCLVLGGEPIPGATDLISVLRAADVRVLVATNNSTRTPADVAERLTAILGIRFAAEDVVTSAMAAARLLGPEDDPVFTVGAEGLRATLTAFGRMVGGDPGDAASLVVGLDTSFDYEKLHAAAVVARRGGTFVATNDDPTFPSRGPDSPGAGAIVAAVATAAGRHPVVAGKPNRPMIDTLGESLAPGDTWMVGDRITTDIDFAIAGGWSPILVMTGVTHDPALLGARTGVAVVDSVADLLSRFQ